MPDIDLPACQAAFEAASRKPQLAEAWFYDWGQRLLDKVEELQSQRDEALSWIKTVTDRLEPNDSSILAATVSAANRWLGELVAKASNAAMSEAAPAPIAESRLSLAIQARLADAATRSRTRQNSAMCESDFQSGFPSPRPTPVRGS